MSPIDPVHQATKTLSEARRISIVSAGFAGGQAKRGVDLGPEAILNADLEQRLSENLGCSVRVRDAVQNRQAAQPAIAAKYVNGMKNAQNVSAATQAIAKEVYESVKAGEIALTLGGDHSIAIGTLIGTHRAIQERLGKGKKIGVIYLDAHADINTPATSASKNMHGMALAFASGLANAEEFSWIHEDDWIDLSKMVYIGLRDVDDAEWEVINVYGIRAFKMTDIEREGIEKIVAAAMKHIGEDVPIHLSLDIDGLDPEIAPSTGLPVKGGVSLSDGCYMTETVGKSGQLVSLDLVEINPEISGEGSAQTIEAGIKLIEAALAAVGSS